jgi:hypothetical protein
MDKINGYTRSQAQSLIACVVGGRAMGKTLTHIFAEYAKTYGRACGSVRNYYYALLKNCDDEEISKLIIKNKLKAESIKPFSDEETDKILRAIIRQKAQGVSVRKAVLNLSCGDDKAMLRYQNKYRNMLVKHPEVIDRLMGEYSKQDYTAEHRKIQKGIDDLYDSLAANLKVENKRLNGIIKKLTDENYLLNLKVKNLQS